MEIVEVADIGHPLTTAPSSEGAICSGRTMRGYPKRKTPLKSPKIAENRQKSPKIAEIAENRLTKKLPPSREGGRGRGGSRARPPNLRCHD